MMAAGRMTYGRGTDALMIIIRPGDRLAASREVVEPAEPFPPLIADWLSRFDAARIELARVSGLPCAGYFACGSDGRSFGCPANASGATWRSALVT